MDPIRLFGVDLFLSVIIGKMKEAKITYLYQGESEHPDRKKV
jgi:hypothetical protein